MQLAVCWPLAPMAHSLTHTTTTTTTTKKPAQLGINRDSWQTEAMRCRCTTRGFCCRQQATVCASIKTPLRSLP